jgi:hypothetical protein
MRLLCYAGVFWMAAQLGRDRGRAHRGLVMVALIGVAYAVYGLVVYLGGSETILWFDKWAYIGDLCSTFVNRNAYGAYAGIGIVCCVALFVNGMRHVWRGARGARDHAEAVLVRSLPYLAAAALMGTALMMTHSRAAYVCTGLAVVVLMAALATAKVVPPRHAILLGLAVLGLGVVITLSSGEGTFQRFAWGGISDSERDQMARLTLTAIGDAPWGGFGLGAFTPAFWLFRDASLAQAVVVDKAHQVYLETAMELGVPAALLLLLPVVMVMATMVRGLRRRRRDHVYPAVGLAAAALLGIHGLVDFSVQMPAVAVTFSFLLGLGYAQSFNTAPPSASRAAP